MGDCWPEDQSYLIRYNLSENCNKYLAQEDAISTIATIILYHEMESEWKNYRGRDMVKHPQLDSLCNRCISS